MHSFTLKTTDDKERIQYSYSSTVQSDGTALTEVFHQQYSIHDVVPPRLAETFAGSSEEFPSISFSLLLGPIHFFSLIQTQDR